MDGYAAGQNLRQARELAGLSQGALAETSSVSVRTIRGLESGTITRPRRVSVDKISRALGLSGELRRTLLAAWGRTSAGAAVRDVEEMVRSPEQYASVLAAVRGRIDRCAIAYARADVTVANRCIVREDHERVVVPKVAGVEDTVNIVSHGLTGPIPAMRALENCTLTRVRVIGDRLRAYDLGFGRRLAVGEPHWYRTRTDYPVDRSTRRVVGGESDCSLVGFHLAAQLLLVRVRFDAHDPPRHCVQVFTDHMGHDHVDRAAVPISPTAHAELVVVEPPVGWHGLRWQW